jgi:hypothetical protein
MELDDAFTSRLGLGQGSIRPTSLPAGSGEYAFVLGKDDPGRLFELAFGDRASWEGDQSGWTLPSRN